MAREVTFEWPYSQRQKVRQVIRIHDDRIKDFRKIWDIVIPNLRQKHSVTFRQMRDPISNKPWNPLSKKYAEWKMKNYPGKRILELTGTMRRAASKKGARGQVAISKKRAMVFGVDLARIYPLYHQLTNRSRKDGVKIRRPWFGITHQDFALSVEFAIKEVFRKEFKRVRGARVRR